MNRERRIRLERLRLQPFALRIVEYNMRRSSADQRNTLLYRTLADEAHPFNPIQEEAPC